jgi:hypothetical protein
VDVSIAGTDVGIWLGWITTKLLSIFLALGRIDG